MVDIVIVNWNSGHFLEECVKSLSLEENAFRINKIIVVDNASADDSLDKLPASEKIMVIRNPTNLGFSKACNQGFRCCQSEYVLLLNPDARLLPDTLRESIHFMKQRTDVDIMGCQLLEDNGEIAKSCARFPTVLRMCFETIGLSKIAPGIFTPATLMTDWDHRESRLVDQVMGAFMFMRTIIFQKNGYFDERFFVYYEELDFSLRLSKLNGKSYYNTAVKAIHSGQGTTISVKAFRLFLNLKSRLQYCKKHFNPVGYAVIFFCSLVIEPFSRTLLLLVRGRLGEIKNVFKGYTMLVRSLPVNKPLN